MPHVSHTLAEAYSVHHHTGRRANWWFVAGCTLMMICYFLPWFSFAGRSLVGFELSSWLPRELEARYEDSHIGLAASSLWAFAFVGVWALFALGDEFTGMRRNKNRWWVRLLTAGFPLVALLVVMGTFAMLNPVSLDAISQDLRKSETAAVSVTTILSVVLSLSSFGLWAMFLAMFLCGVSVFTHPKAYPAIHPHDPPHGPVPAAAH